MGILVGPDHKLVRLQKIYIILDINLMNLGKEYYLKSYF